MDRKRLAAWVTSVVVAVGVGIGVGWLARDAGTGGAAGATASPSLSVIRPLAEPVVDGHFTFTVLEFGCGLIGVVGTHSDAPPEGQFCHVRLRVDNHDPAFHDYVTREQRIAGVAAPRNRPDPFAMAVRRQPDKVRIGGHNAIEVELWYDVPKDADVTGLRLSGDRDKVAFKSDEIVPHTKGGVLVRLRPADETP